MKAFKYLPATLSLARWAGKNIYTKLFFIIVVFSFSLFGATGVGAAPKCYCETEFKQDEIYHQVLYGKEDKKIGTCALTLAAYSADAISFSPDFIVDREVIITRLLELLKKQDNNKYPGCSEWFDVLSSLEQRRITIEFKKAVPELPIKSLKKDNCGNFTIEYEVKNTTFYTGSGSEKIKHAYFVKDIDNRLKQVTRFKLFNCEFFDREIKAKPPDAEAIKDTEYNALVDSIEGLRQLSLTGKTSTEKVQNLIGKIIKYLLGFTGSLALAMFVGGGLMWMTARGNAERTAKALKMITWASLGVVVILASFVIVEFIFDLFK